MDVLLELQYGCVVGSVSQSDYLDHVFIAEE